MGFVAFDRTINRIALVDDAPEVRDSYRWTVEDARLDPVTEDGPLGSLFDSAHAILASADAAVCDHHLRVSNYATFNGAELVATLYGLGFPAVLCTKWEEAHIDLIRPFRDRIPVLLRPEDLTPQSLVAAVEICVAELTQGFQPGRRPWRTQIHVVEVDEHDQVFFVELPSWSRDEVVRIRLEDVPGSIRELLRPDVRLHAHVNAEAEKQEDLYFSHWEPE